jgi:hypothetical protein
LIERAIANWLTNTNERSYQAALCQVLLSQGHLILYISTHGQMEFGKDIFSIAPDGSYMAYQLKTGDITRKEYRAIEGELKELIELPFNHPSVDKSRVHHAFLVLNGEVSDSVRELIDRMNEDNVRRGRSYAHLDIINGQQLVKEFVTAQGQFMPQDVRDVNLLFRIYTANGRAMLPKANFFELLDRSVFGQVREKAAVGPTDKVRQSVALNALYSSVIITSYVLAPFQRVRNHFALFEAWTALAATMIRFAHEAGVDDKLWAPTLDLVLREIWGSLCELKKETMSREDFLEGDSFGDGGLTYRARVTILLGAIAAFEVRSAGFENYKLDSRFLELVKQHLDRIWMWGESAFPFVASTALYLDVSGEGNRSRQLLGRLLVEYVQLFKQAKDIPLSSPYYGVEEVLQFALEVRVDGADPLELASGSYVVESCVEMLARRGDRDVLARLWPDISHIPLSAFRPPNCWALFCWRAAKGRDVSYHFQDRQSWRELRSRSLGPSPELEHLREHVDLLRGYILVCPHRATTEVIRLLDTHALGLGRVYGAIPD